MPRIFASADAFVLPSRGEGWGLPLMEAMSMGLPTIATAFGGNLDFMNGTNSYLVKVSLPCGMRACICDFARQGLFRTARYGTPLDVMLATGFGSG